jgi:hypothetical protein
MTLATLQAFLMWCSIINVGLLTLTFILCACASDWIYNIHSKFFSLQRDTFNAILYAFIGLYKLIVWAFFIIPYIALLIIR